MRSKIYQNDHLKCLNILGKKPSLYPQHSAAETRQFFYFSEGGGSRRIIPTLKEQWKNTKKSCSSIYSPTSQSLILPIVKKIATLWSLYPCNRVPDLGAMMMNLLWKFWLFFHKEIVRFRCINKTQAWKMHEVSNHLYVILTFFLENQECLEWQDWEAQRCSFLVVVHGKHNSKLVLPHKQFSRDEQGMEYQNHSVKKPWPVKWFMYWSCNLITWPEHIIMARIFSNNFIDNFPMHMRDLTWR